MAKGKSKTKIQDQGKVLLTVQVERWQFDELYRSAKDRGHSLSSEIREALLERYPTMKPSSKKEG